MGSRTILPDEREARRIVATLAAPKFRGRAKLIELSGHSNSLVSESAILALEMTPEERELAVRRGDLVLEVVEALDLPFVSEMRSLRAARRTGGGEDPLAHRSPGNVLERQPRSALEAALEHARFRTATHSHETTIEVVSPGEEGVQTRSGSMWASDAGLGRAYQRVAFRVATSRHHWKVSSEIGKVRWKWDGKYLWLTPNLRVRQGRGTSLVMERLRAAPRP